MNNNMDYYDCLLKCGERYKDMLDQFIDDNNYWGWNKTPTTLENASSLWLFILEFNKGCEDRLPLMKLNRWLGYIQGCIIQWEITTVQTERDWTRPLFRPLDFPDK
jgi:hypothetical protein